MAWEENERQSDQIRLLTFDWIVLVRDICKRWYLIVTVAILAGIGAYLVSDMRFVPQYTTTTTFVVSTQDSSATVYQNLSATTNLASVFSEVLNSSILRTTVLEQVGLDSFEGTIQAGAVPETNLLTLRVTDANPRTAFLVTKAIVENHQVVSYQVMGDIVLEVLQEPKVPTFPSNSSMAMRNLKRITILAAVAMCVLLGVVSYLKDTIRSRTEAKEKLSCRYLGEVCHERKYKTLRAILKRRKTSILITNPATSFQFVETFRKLRRKVERYLPNGGGVLMVTSVLENEGKSTVAVNLALALARKNKRVLLMEGDLRKPACHKVLDLETKESGAVDVIMKKATLAEAVVTDQQTGLDLLPEHRSILASGDLVSDEGMVELLETARLKYDYVVIDTPPMSVATDAESLAELTDGVLLVIRQNGVTAEAANQALAALHKTNTKVLGCVLSNVYTSFFSSLSGSYGYGYGYGYGYNYRYGSEDHGEKGKIAE